MTEPGGNNSLSALSVAPGKLAPAFSPSTLIYTVNVTSAVTSVTISASKADANAAMSGDVSSSAGLGSGQRTIQLQSPGVTTPVTIWVTAPGGSQKTYTVNVTRAAPSANNNLSALTVSPGTLSPSFRSDCTSYSVSVGRNVESINVTATRMDPTARITIDGQGTNSGQARSISLGSPGSTTEIALTVHAPNGSSKTYAITVNREEEVTAADLIRESTVVPIVVKNYLPDLPQKVPLTSDKENPASAPEATSNIFISYRRDDSDHVTGRIDDRLVQQFGRKAVFIDVDSILFGLDFRTDLDTQVAKCDVFLAVIGPDWMGPKDSRGRTRLEDPRDFVRIEIESALKRQIPVIPVLVGRASIPPAEQLPQSLQDLPYRNGISVRSGSDFHRDMDRLIKHLRAHLQNKREGPTTRHVGGEVDVTGGSSHFEAARREAEAIEARSAGSAFEKQEIGPREEDRVASIQTDKTTTDRSQSYVLVGLGLIVLIGAMVSFTILQPKPMPPPVIEKKEDRVAQVVTPPSPSKPAEPVAVPREQVAPVEEQAIVRKPSIHSPQMVRISPESFTMEDSGTEIPSHSYRIIRFTKPFAIAPYETTFDEYDRFARLTGRKLPNDNGWGRGQRPVIDVRWEDAKAYAQWLSQQTGKHYRLPTEAEWEYAARSGGKDEIWAGTSDKSQLKNYAVYSTDRTEPVGKPRKPNGLGLYDMSGNVWEWVEDCWHGDYKGAPTDGSAWLEDQNGNCNQHVERGGSWYHDQDLLRTSIRRRLLIDFGEILSGNGFRLVQDIEP